MKIAQGGLLYSLLHLGGFPGDLTFYSRHCTGRVLEMGAGDGRIAAALVLGESPLTFLQKQQELERQQQQRKHQVTGAQAPIADVESYLGVELCTPLAEKARRRLAVNSSSGSHRILNANFLEPLPDAHGPFDTVIVCANTLFCTPKHEELLKMCAAALVPGGRLLLDVYNAVPWHEDAEYIAQLEADADADAATGADDEAGVPSLLVVVEDEDGCEWQVYEREPIVDVKARRIACAYDFKSESATLSETVVHHYLLPEQLVRLLDGCGFDIDSIDGDFCGAGFDPESAEHVVVRAHLRA